MVAQESVIQTLYVARRDGIPAATLDAVPFELEEALQTQLSVLDRFRANGEQVGGWKVGLTSGGARDRMGKDFRPFGYVLQSRILQSGSQAPYAKIFNCSVEPELC